MLANVDNNQDLECGEFAIQEPLLSSSSNLKIKNTELLHKRKYIKRRVDERIKLKPVLNEWKDVLEPNKVLVSMNTAIFQQEIIMHNANKSFMLNFGFLSKLSDSGFGYIDLNTPFKCLIGSGPLTKNLEKCIIPTECPTNPHVLIDIMHSMICGIATNFFCVLVDKDNQPMFCHLQCAPITKNAQNTVFTDVPDSCWAMLTIQNASQIGSALHYGSTYGLKPSRFNGTGPLTRPKKMTSSKPNIPNTHSVNSDAVGENCSSEENLMRKDNALAGIVITGSAVSETATTEKRPLAESQFQAFKAAIKNAEKSFTSVSQCSLSDASAAVSLDINGEKEP